MLLLFSGNSNKQLANAIAEQLGIPLGERTLQTFHDGEIQCEIVQNVRDADVYIIQSTSFPVNEHIMELLVLTDALRRASARRITAVIPYYGYARQDRKDKQRVPITASLVAKLIEASGMDRVLTVHLHSAQIQGFFDIPMDHLYTSDVLLDALKGLDTNFTVVSADAGGVKRSRVFAQLLNNAPLAILDKRRDGPGASEVMNIMGDVEGKDCLITEDMIDTGGTLIKATEALSKAGARSIYVCCTHAVLSNGAAQKLQDSPITKIIVTDSIYHREGTLPSKFQVVSLAPLLSSAIKSINDGSTISGLFE